MPTTPPGTPPAPEIPPPIQASLTALTPNDARNALLSVYATLHPPGDEGREWTPDTVERIDAIINELLDEAAYAALLLALEHT